MTKRLTPPELARELTQIVARNCGIGVCWDEEHPGKVTAGELVSIQNDVNALCDSMYPNSLAEIWAQHKERNED